VAKTATANIVRCGLRRNIARVAWHHSRNYGGMAQRQDLNERAFRLATYVFRLCPKLAAVSPEHGWVARQLLRSITSIGANLEEGRAPSGRRDMAAKYSIALREAREGKFWARLLAIDPKLAKQLEWVIQETGEFIAMLTVSVKKLRKPQGDSDADPDLV